MILVLAKLLLTRDPAMTLAHARRLAKIGLAAAAALLFVIALAVTVWLWGNHRYADGQEEERAAWEEKMAEIVAARTAAMQLAAQDDTDNAASGQAAIARRREELDNATAGLPDQGLTDRQRAVACAELRRQGRRCEPFTPASAAAGRGAE